MLFLNNFKKTAIAAALVLTAGLGHVALAESWITTSNNNCKIYNSDPQPKETITWSGKCQDGYAHGQGTAQWYQNKQPTDKFVGNYQQGKIHGKGVYTWSDGDKYDGEWVSDKMHGKGVRTWTNGDKYNGEWKDDKMHGKGTYVWLNGDKYVGDWVSNEMHGKGIYTWSDGDKYDGEWEKNNKQGLGKLTFLKNSDAIDGYKEDGIGFWQGNVYVVQGVFVDNEIELECTPTKKACDKAQAEQHRKTDK